MGKSLKSKAATMMVLGKKGGGSDAKKAGPKGSGRVSFQLFSINFKSLLCTYLLHSNLAIVTFHC